MIDKNSTLTIRPAAWHDAERLFEWRNDETTRAMSINTDEVAWESHVTWLTNWLDRRPPSLFIAEIGAVPVATFRVYGTEVSYTVAPAYRGKGIASALLQMIKDRHGQLTARIKAANVGSIRAAERAGHRVVIIGDDGQPDPDRPPPGFEPGV